MNCFRLGILLLLFVIDRCKSPDIRPETLAALGATTFDFPSIISDGEMNNYHDRAVLTKFNRAMARRGPASVSSAGDSVDDYIFGFSDDEIEVHSGEDIITIEGFSLGTTDDNIDLGSADFDVGEEVAMRQEVVTQVPLCFHCRRPADTLDKDSGAAYFCDPPRQCRQEGWSYDCLTATWKLYCEKRDELNDLPLGTWVKELTTRECQLSNEPYEEFLNHLGIKKEDDSWWKAEFGGWSGGMSDNAQRVNLELESTFEEGFAPIKDIPPEHPVLMETLQAENWDNERGLRKITDWADYYKLRGISPDSPAALLLTFPLTLYHAIFEHCAAPIKAARMNQRPLRIDVVGAEKELHFLSLFQETSFLCPEDLPLELVFVVRKDMMPPAEKKKRDKTVTVFQKGNIRIKLIGGTYGETIDPRFDCGRACNPDAVMAFNAGRYAYESWRSAVEYLHVQKSVVGIFTDYNEWSGVQCASLGGSKARLSLSVNPFRQPRAMPVYSMNLPQVGNGFMYVFNEQEVED